MRQDQFDIHSKIEGEHWWFTARRDIILNQIRLEKPNARFIAEIGCGSGGNLAEFESRGYQVVGADIDEHATALARKKVSGQVFDGDYQRYFGDLVEKIDVVVLADVLEHIENDKAFIDQVLNFFKPGTLIVLTVPAFKSLWSHHDVVLGHCRRYRSQSLTTLIDKNPNSEMLFTSYFNTVLFPLIWLVRAFSNLLRVGRNEVNNSKDSDHSDLTLPPKFVNKVLYWLFKMENLWLSKKFKAPFGVSLITTFLVK